MLRCFWDGKEKILGSHRNQRQWVAVNVGRTEGEGRGAFNAYGSCKVGERDKRGGNDTLQGRGGAGIQRALVRRKGLALQKEGR